ncbi:hypothetical protein [Bradyrhizobium erythrophlei]|uniref:Uncharacterized protein n=1 Tax=Bradyrhizobium erythrophlei TaxID=1437360 RepID=A0A1M5NBA5_9BRAD|nr:hypothetical protein [Bradyrhizobium erythrophlei]SHG86771.1 hypothetical protein SAMN05443248_2912 [Bradyrhizobium erythrophlei]
MKQWWRKGSLSNLALASERCRELIATDPDFRYRVVEHCRSLSRKNFSDPEWRKRQGFLGVDEIELLMQDVRNGLPYHEIGDRWLISESEVSYLARTRGIHRRPTRILREPSLKQLVGIVKAARRGVVYNLIAQQFRMPFHRIIGIAHRAGIRREHRRSCWWESLPLDRFQELVRRLRTTEPYADMAIDYDVSSSAIASCSRQLGFCRGKRWNRGVSQDRIQANAERRRWRIAEQKMARASC